MTADIDDTQDDDFPAGLASLRRFDVSGNRARELRRRCHAMLQTEPPVQRSSWVMDGAALRRIAVPALGAAWCVAYLLEIVRCTAAIYAYFGTQ